MNKAESRIQNPESLEAVLLSQMATDNCDMAKRMIAIGDIPSARAQLNAALKNLDLLAGLTPISNAKHLTIEA